MWNYEKKIAAWFIIVPAILSLTYAVVSPVNKTIEDRFEVVSSYKGCDVVKYTDESQRWHYFLKCAPETYEYRIETSKNQLEPK